MLEFNNLEEMKPYYNQETNTYEFVKDGQEVDVKFNFFFKINGTRANIRAGDIDAWNIIDAGDISARNIDAGDIKAYNIKACNVRADGGIKARYIEALSVYAWSCLSANGIKALEIHVRDI